MTAARPSNFNYPLNGLRGLCIVLVFIYHIVNSGLIEKDPTNSLATAFMYFLTSFRYGVEIFFMISGYVIIGSLRRHDTLKAFFTDRALRIFPTWLPIHLTLFILAPLAGWGIFAEPHSNLDLISYFFAAGLFLPPLLPFPLIHPAAWSLSYEWCFYILAATGLVMTKIRPTKTPAILFTFVIAALLINIYPRALFFIPGALLALNEDKLKEYKKFFRFPLLGLIVFLLAWRATGAERAEAYTPMTEWFQDHRILFASLALIAGTYMFAGITIGLGLVSKWLTHPIAQVYGNISYGFYLWSPLMMFGTKKIATQIITPAVGEGAGLAFFIISSFVLSTSISWLNWRIIETTFTKNIKRRLAISRPKAA